jgi:hypothetical protein
MLLATLGGAWIFMLLVLVLLFASSALPVSPGKDVGLAIGVLARAFGFVTIAVIAVLTGSGLTSVKKP